MSRGDPFPRRNVLLSDGTEFLRDDIGVHELFDLEITRVDRVSAGANPGARVTLLKRRDANGFTIPSDDGPRERADTLREVIRKSMHEAALLLRATGTETVRGAASGVLSDPLWTAVDALAQSPFGDLTIDEARERFRDDDSPGGRALRRLNLI